MRTRIRARVDSKRGGRLRGRQTTSPDTRLWLRRTSSFLVCKDLKDADENITDYGDGSVIPCTDDHSIYYGIEDKEGMDSHLAVTHFDTYIIGDAHTNDCENRHSIFASGWRSSGCLEASSPEVSRLPCTETQLT